MKLLDRVVAECEYSRFIGAFQDALGPNPTLEEVSRALATGQLPRGYGRAYYWSALLPAGTVGSWTDSLAVLSAKYSVPPGRDHYQSPPVVEVIWAMSPIAAEELLDHPVLEAARLVSEWRPEPGIWQIGGPLELARTLEDVVKQNPIGWGTTPLKVAMTLRHPIYIGHYLRAMAEVCRTADIPINELFDLMTLLRTHPWEPGPPGFYDSDSNGGWRGVDQAVVQVIRTLADADLGFGDRSEKAWNILVSGVSDRFEPSGLLGEVEDPYHSAINRPCTRALQATLAAMG